MEIKGLKFAENKDFGHCIRGAVPAIWDIAIECAGGKPGTVPSVGAIVTAIKRQLDEESGWGYNIFDALIQDSEDE